MENRDGWGEGEVYTSVTMGNRKAGAQLEVMSKEMAHLMMTLNNACSGCSFRYTVTAC